MTPVLWVTWRETLYFSASEVVCFVTKTDPQPQMAKVHRLNQIVGFFFGARDSWDVAFVFCFVTQMAPVQKRPSTVNPVTGLFGNLEAVTESCPTEAGVGVKEVCVCVSHSVSKSPVLFTFTAGDRSPPILPVQQRGYRLVLKQWRTLHCVPASNAMTPLVSLAAVGLFPWWFFA